MDQVLTEAYCDVVFIISGLLKNPVGFLWLHM